ncbi:hypothetical protein J2S43_004049 [Catenuloplanes nepalensis]|uniref:Uncharacterized protein n=1 Tax=Catenuloplanes nepalensis TaxID=587533 RepID=A0ABT9MVR7_9ACTN|nr:hypothetical protein [Catenuloplanes nepalensis]MDP9795537.1 hypothetical protein [Catenuloplanes nepalensis]
MGVVIAGLMVVALPADERTFAFVAFGTHMFMSVVLPFHGVLLGRDLLASAGREAAPVLGTAVLIGVVAGLAGDLLAVLALAAAGGTWAGAGTVLVGGVLVQVVANLTGTGLGALIRPAWVACLATIVVPLGLWALLLLVPPLGDWLTPFPVAGTLLSGDVAAIDWARWTVVALVWGVALNATAVRHARTHAQLPR